MKLIRSLPQTLIFSELALVAFLGCDRQVGKVAEEAGVKQINQTSAPVPTASNTGTNIPIANGPTTSNVPSLSSAGSLPPVVDQNEFAKRFYDQHGRDRVAKIECRPASPQDVVSLNKTFVRSLPTQYFVAYFDKDAVVLLVAPVDDLDSLCSALKFGKVLSKDPSSKTISLQISAANLEPPKR